jgi:hypothetical protein
VIAIVGSVLAGDGFQVVGVSVGGDEPIGRIHLELERGVFERADPTRSSIKTVTLRVTSQLGNGAPSAQQGR